MGEVKIRLAVESDLPKLEWGGRYTHYRALFRRIYGDHVAGRQVMFVADRAGFPVGQVFVNVTYGLGAVPGMPHGYLYALRVMPSMRRQGLGTALVQAAEAYLDERKYRRATIAVGKGNAGAMRLYRRLGYTVIDENAGCWCYTDHEGRTRHVEEPCWVMEKWLAAAPTAVRR